MQYQNPQEIFDLVTQNLGCTVECSAADLKLCADKLQEFKMLPKEEQHCNCLCFLRYEGCCGANDTGRIAYLMNPDKEATFEITLRVDLCIEEEKDERELQLILPPNTKLGLACTKTFTIPECSLCFSIQKEVIV